MKKFLCLFLMLVTFTGCKTTYDVTLNNGKKIKGVTKPSLDKKTDQFRFTLPDGREVQVPTSRIRIIEPQGESSQPKFISPTQKK